MAQTPQEKARARLLAQVLGAAAVTGGDLAGTWPGGTRSARPGPATT